MTGVHTIASCLARELKSRDLKKGKGKGNHKGDHEDRKGKGDHKGDHTGNEDSMEDHKGDHKGNEDRKGKGDNKGDHKGYHKGNEDREGKGGFKGGDDEDEVHCLPHKRQRGPNDGDYDATDDPNASTGAYDATGDYYTDSDKWDCDKWDYVYDDWGYDGWGYDNYGNPMSTWVPQTPSRMAVPNTPATKWSRDLNSPAQEGQNSSSSTASWLGVPAPVQKPRRNL